MRNLESIITEAVAAGVTVDKCESQKNYNGAKVEEVCKKHGLSSEESAIVHYEVNKQYKNRKLKGCDGGSIFRKDCRICKSKSPVKSTFDNEKSPN